MLGAVGCWIRIEVSPARRSARCVARAPSHACHGVLRAFGDVTCSRLRRRCSWQQLLHTVARTAPLSARSRGLRSASRAGRSPTRRGWRRGSRSARRRRPVRRAATSKPSMSGSCTSSSTTSGRSRPASVIACAPSAASPTTSNPSASRSTRAEARNDGWSSTMRTRGPTGDSVAAATATDGTAGRTSRCGRFPYCDPARPAAAAISRTAPAGSPAPNTALPATNSVAPASAQRAAVSAPMPPSTSITGVRVR